MRSERRACDENTAGGWTVAPATAGFSAAGALWQGMVAFVAIGIVLSLAGLAGILWCITKAAQLRRADMSDDAIRAELGRLVFAHTAAIGTAFVGLGLLVVGLLLQ